MHRMSRVRTIVAGALAAALGVLAFAACNGDDGPKVKHILIAGRVGGDVVAPSRASERLIPLDERDAFTQVVGQELVLDLAASGEARLTTAAALIPSAGVKLPDAARLLFEVRWSVAGGKEARAEVGALDATAAWTPLSIDVGGALKERTKLRLIARVAEGAPAIPPGQRVAWAVPHVRGYIGAPLSTVPEKVQREHASAPNVLLISIDTLRADHLSCYGYERPTTPNIDALAKEGVLFEDAMSSAPWTLPSYGSLFTGLTPGRHYAGYYRDMEELYGTDKVLDPNRPKSKISRQPLRSDVPTLAGLLAEHGWATAGFVNNVFLLPTLGLDRGFQRYAQYQYNAIMGADTALAWIREQSRPWFCFAHFMDPHLPYCPPIPWDTKFTDVALADRPDWPPKLDGLRKNGLGADGKQALIAHYDGEIAFTDDQIGRMLRELDASGALENTIVVIHADHGEEFWEHGGYEHGHSQYREVLHVPLIVRFPGKVPAGMRVSSRVRSMDLFPTLLELTGIDVPSGIDAQSLLPLLDGKRHPPRDVVSEFLLWSNHEFKAFIHDDAKLITNGASENQLFDLSCNPLERVPAPSDCALATERADALRAERLELLRTHHARTMREVPPTVLYKLKDGEMELLEQTGYGGAIEEEKSDASQPPGGN